MLTAEQLAALGRLPLTLSLPDPSTTVGLDLMTVYCNVLAALDRATPAVREWFLDRLDFHASHDETGTTCGPHGAGCEAALMVTIYGDGGPSDIRLFGSMLEGRITDPAVLARDAAVSA